MDKIRPLGKREFLFPFVVLFLVSAGLMYVFYYIGFANGTEDMKADDPMSATSLFPLDEVSDRAGVVEGSSNYMYFISDPVFVFDGEKSYYVDIYNSGEKLETMEFGWDYQTPIEHRLKISSDGSELYYINTDNTALMKLDSSGEEVVVYEAEAPYTYVSSFALDSDNDWFVTAHSEYPDYNNAADIDSALISDVELMEFTESYLIRAVANSRYIFQTNMSGAQVGGGAATIVVTNALLEPQDVDTGHNWVLASNGSSLLISDICDFICDTPLYRMDLQTLEYEEVVANPINSYVTAVTHDSVSVSSVIPFSYATTTLDEAATYTAYELIEL